MQTTRKENPEVIGQKRNLTQRKSQNEFLKAGTQSAGESLKKEEARFWEN